MPFSKSFSNFNWWMQLTLWSPSSTHPLKTWTFLLQRSFILVRCAAHSGLLRLCTSISRSPYAGFGTFFKFWWRRKLTGKLSNKQLNRKIIVTQNKYYQRKKMRKREWESRRKGSLNSSASASCIQVCRHLCIPVFFSVARTYCDLVPLTEHLFQPQAQHFVLQDKLVYLEFAPRLNEDFHFIRNNERVGSQEYYIERFYL